MSDNDQDCCPLTDAQQKELDRRLEKYRDKPHEGYSWEELKQRLRPNTER